MDDGGAGPASSHMTTYMSGTYLGRVEIVGGRRRWTVEQKLAMLTDAFGPGESVSAACERYWIGSGTWRRRAFNGELDGRKPAARAISEAAFAEVALSVQIGQTPAEPA